MAEAPQTTALHRALCQRPTYGGVPPRVAQLELAVAIVLSNLAGREALALAVVAASVALAHLLLAQATRRDPDAIVSAARSLRWRGFYPAQPLLGARPPRQAPALPALSF